MLADDAGSTTPETASPGGSAPDSWTDGGVGTEDPADAGFGDAAPSSETDTSGLSDGSVADAAAAAPDVKASDLVDAAYEDVVDAGAYEDVAAETAGAPDAAAPDAPDPAVDTAPAAPVVDCGSGPAVPVPELCNAEDDDCDGAIDEDFLLLGRPCGLTAGSEPALIAWECAPNGLETICEADFGQSLGPVPSAGALGEPVWIDGPCLGPGLLHLKDQIGSAPLSLLIDGRLQVTSYASNNDFEYSFGPSIEWSVSHGTTASIDKGYAKGVSYEPGTWDGSDHGLSFAVPPSGGVFVATANSNGKFKESDHPMVARSGSVSWEIDRPDLEWTESVMAAASPDGTFTSVWWSTKTTKALVLRQASSGLTLSETVIWNLPIPLSAIALEPDGGVLAIGRRGKRPAAARIFSPSGAVWERRLTASDYGPWEFAWHRTRIVSRPGGGAFVLLPKPLIVLALGQTGDLQWARTLAPGWTMRAEMASAGQGVLVSAVLPGPNVWSTIEPEQSAVWRLTSAGETAFATAVLPELIGGFSALGLQGDVFLAGVVDTGSEMITIGRLHGDGSLPQGCTPSGNEGDYCGGDDSLCNDGLVCHDLQGSRCHPPAEAGKHCDEHADCKAGLVCLVDEAAVGQYADCTFDNQTPQYCGSPPKKSCELPSTGGFCLGDEECAEGLQCVTVKQCPGTMDQSPICGWGGHCCLPDDELCAGFQ